MLKKIITRIEQHPYCTFFPYVFIAITLIISLHWIITTGYIEDDAYITFRFAKQIANGHGFEYNPGQPIYGTSTPFFALLLALWIRFISENVIFGAMLFSVLSLIGAEWFVLLTLKSLKRPINDQVFVLAAITFSSKIIYMSIHGMEMPLVLLFLSVSLYLYSRQSFFLCGIFCGLLLFTRMDLFLWSLILTIFTFLRNKKGVVLIIAGAVLVYGPWLVYAQSVFGSIIPYTVTAKWTAYSKFNYIPYYQHIKIILEYLSPLDMITKFTFIGPMIMLPPIVWAGWKRKLFAENEVLIILIFSIAEIALLTFTKATFFNRYFVALLWCVLILFGLSLARIWQISNDSSAKRLVFYLSLFALLIAISITGNNFRNYIADRQISRFDKSLKEIGLWLNQNSEIDSTILLEPLGYVGYFSGRIILDEVGLVTPEVVKLKDQGLISEEYLEILEPDYTILHCENAFYRAAAENSYLANQYSMVLERNPLNFVVASYNPDDDPRGSIRNSCYQIWQRK